jgi:hypothetical protein
MSNQKSLVGLAFPSLNPLQTYRAKESFDKANNFGGPRSLGEPVLLTENVYGYPVSAGSPHRFFSAAATAGGRIVKFTETNVTPQNKSGSYGTKKFPKSTTGKTPQKKDPGYDRKGDPSSNTPVTPQKDKAVDYNRGPSAPKNTDDGKTVSHGGKVKAGDYSATPCCEGDWITTKKKISAVKFEMAGSQPMKNSNGMLREGKYFVMGLDETHGVVTLSTEAKLGNFLYNVDLNDLQEGTDVAKAKETCSPGVMKAMNKQMKGRKKTEAGVTSSLAGTHTPAGTMTAESHPQVNEDSPHGQGLRLLKHMRESRGVEFDGNVAAQRAANRAATVEPVAAPVESTPVPARKQVVLNEDLPSTPGSASGMVPGSVLPNTGQITESSLCEMHGLPPLNADLQNQMVAFSASAATGTAMSQKLPAGITDQIAEAHINESVGVDSLDPEKFAMVQTLTALQESGVDIDNLSEEDLNAALLEHEKDDGFDEQAEAWGEIDFSEAVGKGGLASMLKEYGVANAKLVAAHLQAGDPANEWFGETGGSLQAAKRLQWRFDNVG